MWEQDPKGGMKKPRSLLDSLRGRGKGGDADHWATSSRQAGEAPGRGLVSGGLELGRRHPRGEHGTCECLQERACVHVSTERVEI